LKPRRRSVLIVDLHMSKVGGSELTELLSQLTSKRSPPSSAELLAERSHDAALPGPARDSADAEAETAIAPRG
jgi:hypothetical protein